MKIIIKAWVGVLGAYLLFCFLPSYGSAKSSLLERQQSPTSVGGLQLAVSTVDINKTDVPQFQIAFHNDGENDIVLDLGTMLANGKVLLPYKISLNLTDASGKTRKLTFFDKRYPVVAGRVDDYIVPLRGGSTYTVRVGLDQFISQETNEYELKLPKGKSQIVAMFEGGEANGVNLDTQGIKLMNLWRGSVQSNTLTIER
ncbi:MAG TPA: hypothetical protein VFC63_12675 [Blastocatellia bacterium]|nr:hypothetical protein [Blastocatellia bacterium]